MDKILIIDDDKEFIEELKEFLKGYNIVEALNASKALAEIKRPNDIGLIFLDMRLPDMDGIELLKKIKKIQPDIKIIIITGYGSKEIVLEALHNKADDYIEKPLELANVRFLVDKFLCGNKQDKILDLDDKIAKIEDYLEINVFKKITLVDVANYLCLSPKYLSRVFFEKKKIRFTDLRLKIKIGKAKELLKKGYLVGQIADKLGYENTESFTRQFKKVTGVNPLAFKKKVKLKNGKK